MLNDVIIKTYSEKDPNCSYLPHNVYNDAILPNKKDKRLTDFLKIVNDMPSRVDAADKIRLKLLITLKNDTALGISMWKLWIKATLYKRRSQDATYITLEEIVSIFGNDYIENVLSKDDELTDLLFLYSSFPPLKFLSSIKNNEQLFKKCLISLSHNNFNYVINNAVEIYGNKSLYRYHLHVHGLSNLSLYFSEIIKNTDPYSEIKVFLFNYIQNFYKENKKYVLDTAGENMKYILSKPISVIPLPQKHAINHIHQTAVEGFFTSITNFNEYASAIIKSLDYLSENYPFTFIFSPSSKKKDLITAYLIEHADFYLNLPSLASNSPDNNYICAFSDENFIYYDSVAFYGKFCFRVLDFLISETIFWDVYDYKNKNHVRPLDDQAESFSKLLDRNLIPESLEQTKKALHSLISKFDDMRETSRTLIGNVPFNIDYQAVSNLRNFIFDKIIDSGEYPIKWVKERELFNRVRIFYPDAIFQYAASWLHGQIYDIYIPSRNMAIEYQGAQHYKPIEYFGGEDGYQNCLKRDRRKKDISIKYGVTIKYWKYTKEITKQSVEEFLTEL